MPPPASYTAKLIFSEPPNHAKPASPPTATQLPTDASFATAKPNFLSPTTQLPNTEPPAEVRLATARPNVLPPALEPAAVVLHASVKPRVVPPTAELLADAPLASARPNVLSPALEQASIVPLASVKPRVVPPTAELFADAPLASARPNVLPPTSEQAAIVPLACLKPNVVLSLDSSPLATANPNAGPLAVVPIGNARLNAAALAIGMLSFFGCGSYSDFSLPAVQSQTRFDLQWRPTSEVNLPRGEALDVLNPSVVRHGAGLLNLYSRFDGRRWDTYAATSVDGLRWENSRRVLSPELPWEGSYIAANGGAVSFKGELLYVYQAGEKGRTILGLARSSDGVTWRKHSEPILKLGPWRSWDEVSLGDPYVWESSGVLYLCYLGEDRARRQRLGLARSTDGIHWEKQRSSPILDLGSYGDFDENGLGEPAIFISGKQWVMLYTGRDRKEHRAMGYAVSDDGRLWKKLREPVLRGANSWDSIVICDATVMAEASRLRIWYGGGDKPSPDERLNGQIGYAELPLTTQ